MTMHYVSAVFDTQSEAEHAVSELRDSGIPDTAISLVSQRDGKNHSTDGSGHDTTQDFLGKAALGAGIGTALGIAALAIPGVGPLVAAGAIAAAAIPAAAMTGAAAGLAAGSLASVFSDRGIGEADAHYYEHNVGQGGVLVTVNSGEVPNSGATGAGGASAQEILYRTGGHSSAQAKLSRM